MEILKHIPFFVTLSEEKLQRLANISTSKSYKRGEILFYEGDESKHLLLLIKGLVEIFKVANNGREVHLHDIRPISFVAEMANLNESSYPATARFSSAGEILRIDYAKFKAEFLSEPQVCIGLIKSMAKKIMLMDESFNRNVLLSSDEKIANFIIENFDIFTSAKHIKIAKILNIAPETFSRTITKFKKFGALIVDESGKIVSFDQERLLEFV